MEIPKEEFKCSLPIQIRFSDIDSIGHINNNIYFSYFDLGKINYLEKMKSTSIDWTEGSIVLANINVDFYSPIYYKETIVVESKITELGGKSGTFLQQIRNVKTNEIKCRCRSVFVAYDTALQTSMVIPERWREIISEIEEINYCLDN